MPRLLARPAAALLALTLALPAVAAPGLRLSWDHCAADGRVANKAFACDTNTGSDLLVFSYEPPVAMSNCNGIETVVHIKSASVTMPDWWQLASGGCRFGALSFSLSPAEAGGCTFPYGEVFAGGIGSFTADLAGPGSWRVLVLAATPSDQPWAVAPGNEYHAFALQLRRTKTVGSGACAGCAAPMCIGFGLATLYDANNQGLTMTMTADGPNPGGGEESVAWQGAYMRAYDPFGPDAVPTTCDPDDSAPARKSTWGAVKSLYR